MHFPRDLRIGSRKKKKGTLILHEQRHLFADKPLGYVEGTLLIIMVVIIIIIITALIEILMC